ncbi:hypothetical protein ACQJBY_018789 [Aegilops geniculata]
MFLRHSHPVVHPDPAATAPAAQGQGPVAAAPAAVAQAQGQVAPAPAAVAQAQGQGPAPAPAAGAQGPNAPPPGVQMVDPRGAPGTRWGLAARLAQALLAAAAVAFMASTDDFRALTAFRLLVAAESLQCLWSLGLAAVDVYALLVKRSFRTPRATHHIFHRGLGHWSTELRCSEWVGGHDHSHQQRPAAVLGEPLPDLYGRHRHGFLELVRHRAVLCN